MASVITSHIYGKILDLKVILGSYDKYNLTFVLLYY